MFGSSSELMKFWKYGRPYRAVISKQQLRVLAFPRKVFSDVVRGMGR